MNGKRRAVAIAASLFVVRKNLMAVTHYSQKQRAQRMDRQLRNGVSDVNELIIPSGASDQDKAQECDRRLRMLAHADAMRGVLMFQLRLPGADGRPLFQNLSEHGMTETSTFAEYVDTVHNLSRSQARKDISAAIIWAGVNGLDLMKPEALRTLVRTSPPKPSILLEVKRLAKIETEKLPAADGKNCNVPVRVKNPKLIQSAWKAIEQGSNGSDKPLTTTAVRNILAKKSFYDRAGVKLPMKQPPKDKIAKLAVELESLTATLDGFEEHENGIAGVLKECGCNAMRRKRCKERLQSCAEAIATAIARVS